MKKKNAACQVRILLLRLIDEAYDKQAWHGPNLKGSVRRVSVDEAVWRPGRARHNIAEIAVHCAYWKYAVRRRIRGDKRGSFPLKGSNWFALPAKMSQSQWRDYVALLDEQHGALRLAIAEAPPTQLFTGRGDELIPAPHTHGVALHDTYHAGQIRTIKTLFKHSTRRR